MSSEKSKSNDKSKAILKSIVFVALFAALEAVSGFIAIPLPISPVPIVLQNMMTVLTGLLLGPILGGASTALFLLLGALGLPIFSGGTGGIARFMAPAGGFLWGYLLASIVAGCFVGRPNSSKNTPLWKIIVGTVLAFVVMYIPGSIHFGRVLSKSFKDTMLLSVLPYLPIDLLKAVLSVIITVPLRKTMALSVFNEEKEGESDSLS